MNLIRNLGWAFFRKSLTTIVYTLLASGIATAAFAQVSFSKSFSPDTIGPNSTTTLTFTIDGTGQASSTTALSFTDSLPTSPGSMVISTPPDAVTTCIGGNLTAPAGGTTISYSSGSLASNSSCTVSVNVTADAAGTYTNTSGDLTSSSGNSGTATANLNVVTTLPSFSKSFSPSTVSFGSPSTLTYTIDNSANTQNIANLDFSESLATGIEIASPSNANTNCASNFNDTTLTAPAGGTAISLDANGAAFGGFQVLDAGASCTVSVDVVGKAVGALTTTSEDLLVDFVSAGTATATLNVTGTPLLLTKSFANDPVTPGDNVDLEFTIRNQNRSQQALNIAFTDDLDATLTGLTATGLPSANVCGTGSTLSGTSQLSLSGGSLAPEASCTFSATLQVPASATTGSYRNTTSSVTASIGGTPSTGGPAADNLRVEADLPTFTKSFTNDPVGAGGTVSLQYNISNSSGTANLTNLSFLDELSFLPAPITFSGNTSDVCGTGSSLNLFSGSNPSGGFGNPATITLNGGSLAASASCTFTIDITIPAGVSGGSYPSASGALSGASNGSNFRGSTANDTLQITDGGSVLFSKSFTDDPVASGDIATLEFTITNPSESTATLTSLAFTDDLNAALSGLSATGLPLSNVCGTGSMISGTSNLLFSGGNLAPGESCSFSVATQVPASANPGSYTNSTSDLTGSASGTPFSTRGATDDLVVSGLDFSKEFVGDPVTPGDNVTLRYTIANTGSADATITFFSDNLNSALSGLSASGGAITNTCGGALSGTSNLIYSGGSLTAGSSCQIETLLTIPAGASEGTYASSSSDLSANYNANSITVPPASDALSIESATANVVLSKEFPAISVEPGQSTILEFTLENSGASAASNINFLDDLNAMLPGAQLSATNSNSCSATISGTSLINISNISLAATSSCTINLDISVPSGAAPGTYTNTTSNGGATVNSITAPIDPATTDLVVSAGSAAFTKAFTNPAAPGGSTILEFTITNTGSGALSNLRFTDDLNAALSGLVASGLPASNICGTVSQISGTSSLTFSGGSLGTGESCNFSIAVQVPVSATPGTYTNTTADLVSGVSVISAPATANLVIEVPPSFTKVFAPNPVNASTPSTLTFTIDNSAASLNATSLNFTDNLPAGLIIATPVNANTTCTGGTLTATSGSGVVSYSGGAVAAGASCIVAVDTIATAPASYTNVSSDLTSSLGNSGTASDTLTVNAATDLSITLTDGDDPANVGNSLTYTAEIENLGPSAATSVVATTTLPAGVTFVSTSGCVEDPAGVPTCSLGTIAAGDTTSFTMNVTIDSGTTGTLTNSVSVTSAVPDGITANNNASENTVVNRLPIANAGPDQPAIIEAATVSLDGSASSDPDGDTLTYSWTQTAGTSVTLSDGTAVSPNFTAPTLSSNTPETLTFSLIVNDGTVDSVADTVDITVTNANGAPIADAGPDQPAVAETSIVALDGSASNDPNGDTLTYSWTQTAGTSVTLSDGTAVSPNFTAPTLSSNTPETLTFSLIVNDGTVDSVADTVDIIVTNANGAPIADAGPDQPAVIEAATVTLDGSASSDPDGDTLTYSWTQTAGTSVTLSDGTAVSPNFTAPTLSSNTSETLTFSLIVNDGTVDSVADTVDIIVSNINEVPIANAGQDQPEVIEAASVTLDGTVSSDPDGDTLTYNWTQTAGTSVTLSNTTVVSPTFIAPNLSSNTSETLTFSLIVNDGTTDSAADTVNIIISNINEAPVANAGSDQTDIVNGTTVTLNAEDSSDPDGDELSYRWSQVAGPNVILSDTTSISPSFTAPDLQETTILTFALIANDGQADSEVDQVDIVVLENAPPTLTITGVPETIDGPFTVTFNFSEEVTGFTLEDISVTNGTASNLQNTSGNKGTAKSGASKQESTGNPSVYTALISPEGEGRLTITVSAGVLTDIAGNPIEATTVAATVIDTTNPSVSISTLPAEVRGPFTIQVNFNEEVTGFNANDITLDNASSSEFVSLNAQSYSVLITPLIQGTILIDINANVAQDGAGNGNTAAETATTEFIDEDFVRTRTMAAINNFLVRRADQITLNDPNLALRLLENKTDGHLTGSADDDRAQVNFNASASGEDANLYKLVGADAASRINLWTEVNFSRLKSETAKNSMALAFAGVDYRLSQNTILGFMGQYDWADEEDDREDISVSGQGWMVGPYIVSRLTDNLVFDGRGAWGQSDNEISPFRTYTDEFDTDRWLLKGQFTGDFIVDAWKIYPSLSVIYFEENQQAYTDTLGIDIGSQKVKLGRATFGPRISKNFAYSKKVNFIPNFSVRGIWDFTKTDLLNINTGFASETDELRARTEAGFTALFESGTSLRLDGFYDGIGSENFEAYGVKVNVSFELD